MGQCRECKKVFSSLEMKEKLCENCYSPEVLEKIKHEENVKQARVVEFINKNTNDKRSAKVSRYGFFNIFFNKDFLWIGITIALFIVVFTFQLQGVILVYVLIATFFYNKFYIKGLLKKGYVPVDSFNEDILKYRKFN